MPGFAWSAAYDLKRDGRPAHTLYVAVSWVLNDNVAINANLGADRDFAGARTRRIGVSVVGVAHEQPTVIVDRVKLAGNGPGGSAPASC